MSCCGPPGRRAWARARRSRRAWRGSSSCCRSRSANATSAKPPTTQRRVERRARTGTIDLALRLAQLWLRDLWCVAEGAGELAYALDRLPELEHDAAGRSPARLREGVELVRDTRLRLSLNVSEELALESLAYRLQALLAHAG